MCEKINKTDKKAERLARLQAAATSRGGQCISPEYLGTAKKHRWECSEGHQWEATGNSVVNRGTWCPKCANPGPGLTPGLIEKLHKVAAERGGKCLSTEYLGVLVKHRWECSEGHQWEATPNNIIYYNTWCPVCAGEKRKAGIVKERKPIKTSNPEKLVKLQAVAAERGGKCLSTEYLGVVVKHRWECSEGHQWESTPDSIIRKGAWCPVCADAKRLDPNGLARLQQAAAERGGKCLSTEYLGVLVKHRWECSEGHQWETTGDNVVNHGTWCPVCAGNALDPNGLTRLQQVAAERGGKCLSPEYLGMSNKHRWECSKGHQWEATGDNVVNQGTWCPKCAITGQKLNPGLIEKLHKVAAERGGQCISPEYLGTAKKHRWECSEGHQWEATGNSVVNHGTWCPVCGNAKKGLKKGMEKDPNGLSRLQQVAAGRGGKCLSMEYLGITAKHRWECSKGHQWEAIGSSVVHQGSWCPVCARNKRENTSLAAHQKKDLALAQKLAAAHDGKCLTTRPAKGDEQRLWQCKEGHAWTATPADAKATWCPICAAMEEAQHPERKEELEKLQKAAAKKGGVCLAKEFRGETAKYEWRCKHGHTWRMNAHMLLAWGTWCPRCRTASGKKNVLGRPARP